MPQTLPNFRLTFRCNRLGKLKRVGKTRADEPMQPPNSVEWTGKQTGFSRDTERVVEGTLNDGTEANKISYRERLPIQARIGYSRNDGSITAS